MGNGTFFSRSGAAKAAFSRGFKAIETTPAPINHDGKPMWTWEERDVCAALDLATAFAIGKDYISHVEVTLKRQPVIVVTCTREELPDDIPKSIEVRPVTPELFEKQKPISKTDLELRRVELEMRQRGIATGVPAAPREPGPKREAGGPTKKSIARDLMQRAEGATIAEIHAATSASNEAAAKSLISDVKRMGHEITTTLSSTGVTHYHANVL